MADPITDKDDAAAQKAYADAAAAKSDSKPKAAVESPAVEAPKAEAATPAKPAAEAPAPKKSVASKVAKTPTAAAAKKPAASATATKASAKPKPAKKAVTKKAPAKKVATVKKTTPEKTLSKKTTGAAPAATPRIKDTTMATKTKTTNIASDMANEMQTRLAGMYEKGTEMTGEMVTFQRANAEAMAEAGKILFTGMQDLTRDAVEETRKAADQMSEDARLMAAAKSPTELVKLQGDIMRRSFDHVVATGSKNTEAWIKLANEAFAPLTSRMSETVDKMNKLAA